MSDPLIRAALELRREFRDEYELVLEAHIGAAEEATRGHLSRTGVDVRSIFLGNETYAQAHATDELKAFWRQNPRPTFAAYERARA